MLPLVASLACSTTLARRVYFAHSKVETIRKNLLHLNAKLNLVAGGILGWTRANISLFHWLHGPLQVSSRVTCLIVPVCGFASQRPKHFFLFIVLGDDAYIAQNDDRSFSFALKFTCCLSNSRNRLTSSLKFS